ncbi:MAG: ABC transporter ATP-binding protein [Clostridiales bacterium]|nr:ABC transporter ATP-binding protein [Clostridiales bacterium]
MPRVQRARITDDEVIELPINTQYLRRLLSYLRPYRRQVVLSVLVMLAAAAAGLVSPMVLKIALDEYIEPNRFQGLPLLALTLLAASVASMLCVRWKVLLMDISGRRALATLRDDLFGHIHTLAFDFFDTRSAGKIMVRVINDVNSLLDLFSNGVVTALTNMVTLFLVAGVMLYLDVKLALVAFITIPLLLVFLLLLRPAIKHAWRVVRHKISNMNGYLHESLSGMRVTQAYVREDENSRIFRETNDDIYRSWMHASRINNLFGPSIEIVSVLGTCLIYYFGVRWMYGGDASLTMGTLLSMTWYAGHFWEPLNSLSNLYSQLQVAMASLERIYSIMDTPAIIKDKPDAYEMPDIEGRVEFDHVTFGYDPEQVVLGDVSFSVEPGQTIALVGPTGAGKSTVVNLISRFYDVRKGAVRIDGHDVRDVTLRSLRSHMGIMLQEPFIFSGTIMDNLRYGRLDATDEEVIAAASAVGAHEFIERMEDGYETEVNERGSRLSQGQKQLIAFARALLANPRIMILDEATSSIDTHTEILIQKALEKLLAGRTSFVIAHRLSTIRKADRIMVVSGGTIQESGTHDELMAKKGIYYELCQAQYRFLEEQD